MSECTRLWVLLTFCTTLALTNGGLLEFQTGCVGSNWTCTIRKDCHNPQKILKDGSQIIRTCLLGKDWYGACCITGAEAGTKSRQKCEEYAESVYEREFDPVSETFSVRDTCRSSEPLIVNGEKADPQEFPHMALIGGYYGSTPWFCGGTLISEYFVLSAAHCTADVDGYITARFVRLGEYNVMSVEDDIAGQANPMDYEIVEWYNHPGFNVKYPIIGINDVALYKLNTSVEFNEYIRPICLHSHTNVDLTNKFVIASGWGITENDTRADAHTDFLRRVNLTVTSCRYRDDLRIASVLCASDLSTQRDTCSGDSGGPLQIRLSSPHCMYLQYGVTSFGPANCGRVRPAGYMKVSYFLPWIESIVWP